MQSSQTFKSQEEALRLRVGHFSHIGGIRRGNRIAGGAWYYIGPSHNVERAWLTWHSDFCHDLHREGKDTSSTSS